MSEVGQFDRFWLQLLDGFLRYVTIACGALFAATMFLDLFRRSKR